MATLAIINGLRLQGIKAIQPALLSAGLTALNGEQQNCKMSKHWLPKWKWHRKMKFIKVKLPNYHEKPGDVSEQERNRRMKEKGVLPPRPWNERPITITTTSSVFEPYVPPEGDGKMSTFTKAGAKQKYDFVEKKTKSTLAIRKIRAYDEHFKTSEFAQRAQDIYINSHKALMAKDKHRLRELVTERAYPEMTYNTRYTTIHWEFLKSLEPPRVVHARCTDIVSKENLFGQITVRFHTQQKLAIYDRFGRLMHGSEIIAKDVLEYVVFENNISDLYGVWRLHHKIIPDWAEPKQPSVVTYRVTKQMEQAEDEAQDEGKPQTEEAVESVQLESGNNQGTEGKPPVLTA